MFLIHSVSVFSNQKEQTIPIVLSSNNSIYMKNLSGLKYAIQSKTKIYFLSSIDQPEESFHQIKEESPPMVITIGNAATKSARKYLTNIPIVFLMVNHPRTFHLENGMLGGFSADISARDFFLVLKKIYPNAKRVYSFYSDKSGEFFAKEGKYFDLLMNINLELKELKTKDSFESELESIKGSTDAFFMVYDSLYDRETFSLLSEFCKKNKIILMTYYPELVSVGATFALAPDYTNMGILAGKYVNKLLLEKSIVDKMSVFAPTNPFLYINYSYAKESGIQLSDEIVNRERRERLVAYGIELFNKKKYNSAKSVLTKVLNSDPKNELARKYFDDIIDLQTSNEIKSLLQSAEEYRNKQKYHEAIAIYKKILNLNPNLKDIQTKIDKSVHDKSEFLRKQALSKEKAGNPFEAIKLYKESIQVYPDNNQAKQEYNALVSAESRKIDIYLKQGLNHYNTRKYEDAITTFENVLLVEPGNKVAKEYLYNSILKRDALKRLLECNTVGNQNCSLWKK